MLIHTLYDILAWVSAGIFARWIARRHLLDKYAPRRSFGEDPAYYLCLAAGALIGAYLSGSLNLTLAHIWTLGHSIAGAVAGGIVAVELYKFAHGIRGSTGVVFVGPLALGITIGRLGCFFAGLPDYTYGTPTHLPWGIDFGDGIFRHPVQLYESFAMAAFLILYIAALHRSGGKRPWADWFLANSFYLLVGWYALQRFAWEFLKPYPTLFGPFNLFHLICAALLGYSLLMLRGRHELRPVI